MNDNGVASGSGSRYLKSPLVGQMNHCRKMTAETEIGHPPPRWKPAEKWQSAGQARRRLSRLGARLTERMHVDVDHSRGRIRSRVYVESFTARL